MASRLICSSCHLFSYSRYSEEEVVAAVVRTLLRILLVVPLLVVPLVCRFGIPLVPGVEDVVVRMFLRLLVRMLARLPARRLAQILLVLPRAVAVRVLAVHVPVSLVLVAVECRRHAHRRKGPLKSHLSTLEKCPREQESRVCFLL